MTGFLDDPNRKLAMLQMMQNVGGLLQQWGGLDPIPQPSIYEMAAAQQQLDRGRAEMAQQARMAEAVGGYDPQQDIMWNSGRVQPQGLLAEPAPEPVEGLLSGPTTGQPGRDFGLLDGFTPQQRAVFEAMPNPQNRMAMLQEHHFSAPKDPMIREFKEGDQIVTKSLDRSTGQWVPMSTSPRFSSGANAGRYGEVQVDELGRQYQEGPRGKRHYLPGQGQDALPSVSRDFVLPLLQKVQAGEPLTPEEQQAWDMYSRTGLIDQMLRGMQTGSYIPSTTSPSVPTPADTSEQQTLSYAREAIAAGEDRSAVEAELRAMGIDPSKL